MTQTTNSVPAQSERPAPISLLLEVNVTKGFNDVDEARELALVLKRAFGDDKGIKLREVGTYRNVPLVKPAPVKSTRGKQSAEGTAGNIAKAVRTALEIENVSDFPPVIVLEKDISTWVVDYKAMTENVKTFDSPRYLREDRVAIFQEAVSSVLASEALRGISMK